MADRGSGAGSLGKGKRAPAPDNPARPSTKLGTYRKKRDFSQSPEPSGGSVAGPKRARQNNTWTRLSKGHRFCVQLHRARRLHYDFRLEYHGVLLSWAVPKGPSLDRRQRRLAVQVEDHPVDYGDFEDVIPSGYGAGTVLLWDMGTFSWEKGPKGDAEQGLREGHLDFRLEGVKLQGGFSLIRMDHGQPADKPQWLLVKRQDEHARDSDEGLTQTSVKTGRTLDQVAAGAPTEPVRARRSAALKAVTERAPSGKIPATSSPMLATLVDAPFNNPEWLFELKYDGVRVLLHLEDGKITLQGRSGRDETARYPELQESLALLRASSALLDGEIVSLDRSGRPSFSDLQKRIQLGPRDAVEAAAEKAVVFMAFDLLFLDGRDLRGLPLEQRKQALRSVLGENQRVRYADEVWEKGEAFYEQVRQLELEGVIAKRAQSLYATGKRTRDWLKIKVRPTQDCVICGYVPGRGRRREIGALLLGVYAEGELVPAGRVGTGFSDRQLEELRAQLDRLHSSRSAWPNPDAADRGAVWAKPKLVCEVEHAGWTVTQKLRQPSFRVLRPDVPPKACIREPGISPKDVQVAPVHSGRRPSGAENASEAEGTGEIGEALAALADLPARGGPLRVGARTVNLTHLDKELWPKEGITKRDLIAYHLQIAPYLLPHLRDRAIVTQVFPDGISGKSFWRRAVPDGAPKWLPRWEAHPGTATICPLVQEPAALVWLANQGAIEIHPWHSRRDKPTLPDWAVFDLDPGPKVGLAGAVEVAHLIKAGLDHLKVDFRLKTTGQSGLHIYVPLRRGPAQEVVRDWVGELAQQVARAAPKLVSQTWSVQARGGLVRIDYTQNVIGKTLASVYSPRPAPGAPVSTPIEWEELKNLEPGRYNLKTVLERVAQRGDLFLPVLNGKQRLPKLQDSTKSPSRSDGPGSGRK